MPIEHKIILGLLILCSVAGITALLFFVDGSKDK